VRNCFVTQSSLLTLALLSSQWLSGQTSYPIQGQPHGGDRRGSYVYEGEDAQEGYEETRSIPRLYPDPKLYLHNMTILARVPGIFNRGQMTTIGGNRYVFASGKVVDVSNPAEPVIVNERAPSGEVAYNQALEKWVLMQSNSCCRVYQNVVQGEAPHPALNPPPGGRRGVTFYDVTDPRNIVEISHFATGPGSTGTHGDGNYYDGGRYAYLASRLPGTRGQPPYHIIDHILQIIDVSDMNNPRETSKWWVPGQMRTEETPFLEWPEAKRYIEQAQEETWSPDWKFLYLQFHGPCIPPKRVEDGGNRAYCAWSSLGMRILDFSDIGRPQLVSTMDISPPFDAGIPVHSVYPIPQRKLVIMNGETTRSGCHEGLALPWVVDVRAEKNPVTIATFPVPKPPAEAPYNDFCFRGGRLGPHHPNNYKAPGEMRVDLIGFSWFEGGWRLYDISNPFRPEEVAWIVPPVGTRRGTEAALIEWDRKIIHVFDDTGLYILSSPALGEPVLGLLKPESWSVEGLNVGAP